MEISLTNVCQWTDSCQSFERSCVLAYYVAIFTDTNLPSRNSALAESSLHGCFTLYVGTVVSTDLYSGSLVGIASQTAIGKLTRWFSTNLSISPLKNSRNQRLPSVKSIFKVPACSDNYTAFLVYLDNTLDAVQ